VEEVEVVENWGSNAVQCAAREEEEEEKRFLICDMALISLAAVGVVGVGVGLYNINCPLLIR
jgi:hypothetical protein